MAASVVLLEVMKKHGCKQARGAGPQGRSLEALTDCCAPADCHPSAPVTPRPQLVFSSSCTVYGQPKRVPLTEDSELAAINPYGRTKLFQEEMFRCVVAPYCRCKRRQTNAMEMLARSPWPQGRRGGRPRPARHPAALLQPHRRAPERRAGRAPCRCAQQPAPMGAAGEWHARSPACCCSVPLRGWISRCPAHPQVALGQREFLRVFGGNYDTPGERARSLHQLLTDTTQLPAIRAHRSPLAADTPHHHAPPDGTAVRDYIHVMDLAEGHVAALDKLLQSPSFGCQAVNLGGCSRRCKACRRSLYPTQCTTSTGTGKGTSVLELVAAFEKASGATVPYKVRSLHA